VKCFLSNYPAKYRTPVAIGYWQLQTIYQAW
jgi:hypothetical protein